MSKRNTKEGKKARREGRIKRLRETGIYHPIAGMQSAAPKSSKPNKYKPRRNTPKSERASAPQPAQVEMFASRPVGLTYGGKSELEMNLGHAPRPRKPRGKKR